ncbi:DUF262 domain-containing protein [Silvimonas iriomotensis]|uniref:DUF262 domain-containing protein n=1 Tax=Silvimonas iriomotensis TaxID=449662 RepID=A0ABQ2PDZ7_9NEIS|nr:DUF262 domain-containing protein [Silvimonas iriomotensis]GGP23787.1 hypothetical protein GCM10010970_37870 [Silvimonas iriomotensis]
MSHSSFLNPTTVISGSPLALKDLLQQPHCVPPYQRDFVWKKATVEELWVDLIDHYKRFAANDQIKTPSGYFLGAMVVVKEPESNGPYELTDGQQRMTALTCMMSVLLDLVNQHLSGEEREGYAHQIKSLIGSFNGGWTTNLSFSDETVTEFFAQSCLLKSTKDEKNVFWSGVETKKTLDGNKKTSPLVKIKEAIECSYEQAEKFLSSSSDPARKVLRLKSFISLTLETVIVLRITALSHANAYAIFESLNSRGLDLSHGDLIKNELLKKAEARRDDVLANWNELKETLEFDDDLRLTDFLHYSYLSRHGKVKAAELFKKVKERLEDSPKAMQYSAELLEDAGALRAMLRSHPMEWTDKTRYMLSDISNVLGVKLSYPYLIAVYRNFSDNIHLIERHVQLAMNFSFRFMKVIDGDVSILANTMQKASELASQENSLQKISNLFSEHASDALFKESFEKISLTSSKIGYFSIYWIETYLLNGSVPLKHGVDQHLEHIMPKSPSQKDWPIAKHNKDGESVLFKDRLWKVGNLLALPAGINASIKNKAIEHKIKKYQDCDLNLPKSISNYISDSDTEWTFEHIETRQKDLAEIAIHAWSLNT